jgi:hypothetical protein
LLLHSAAPQCNNCHENRTVFAQDFVDLPLCDVKITQMRTEVKCPKAVLEVWALTLDSGSMLEPYVRVLPVARGLISFCGSLEGRLNRLKVVYFELSGQAKLCFIPAHIGVRICCVDVRGILGLVQTRSH